MPASEFSTDPRDQGVEVLDVAECWRLLRLGKIGRLAVTGHDGGIDVMPINFLAHEDHVFFRTAPGGKLQSIEANPEVAFETDGQDEKRRWSVVVRGTAHALTDPSEIEASGISQLMTWSPTKKEHFVRIDPRTVSGRRFPKRYGTTTLEEFVRDAEGADAQDEAADAQEFSQHDGVLPKPWPIPHLPPVTPGD